MKTILSEFKEQFAPLQSIDVTGLTYIDIEALFTPKRKDVLTRVLKEYGWIRKDNDAEARKYLITGLQMLHDVDVLQLSLDLGNQEDISNLEAATLEDRILRLTNFEQKFGTQLLVTYDVIYLIPFMTGVSTLVLRKELELEPLDQFIQSLKDKYKKPVKQLYIKDRWIVS